MGTTQLRGSQILDGSITAADVDDALEKDLTKVRVTTDDLTADFLSSKVVAGTGITVAVVGTSGSNQTLRITATGGAGGGGGSSLTVSGALGNTAYSDVPTTLVFDDSTGFQVADAGSGVAKITIASHFKNIFVSGSDTLIATGSDSVQVEGDGGVQVFTYIDEESYSSGSIPAAKSLVITATALSQSLAARITGITNTIVPASYVQSGTSFGQATLTGTSTEYARADHQHGTPALPAHSGLASLTWSGSGHTGVANSVATWNSSGTAAVSTPTADGQVLTYQGGALKWVTLAAGLAFYNEATEAIEYPGTPVELGSIYIAAAGTIA